MWSREGSIILIECKNQRDPVAAEESLKLEGKMRRYRGRCHLAFFVAPSGFTRPFRAQLAATSTEQHLIVQIDGAGLDELIANSDRGEALKRLFMRAASTLDAAAK